MSRDESVVEKENKESFDTVIMNAVLSVPGVTEVMKCSMTNFAASSLPGERECELELHLAVEYGSSIPSIHENIQTRLKEDVQVATGLEVKKLNLCIEDIYCIPRE